MLKLNLNKKMILIFSACLIMLFCSNLYLFRAAQQEEMVAIRQQWINQAENFNQEIGAQFFQRYNDVQVFAENTVLRGGKPAEITHALNRYVSLYRIYDFIVYIDLKGNVVASSSQDVNGHELDLAKLDRLNFSQAPWFVAALAEKYTEDASKHLVGTFVEDIQIDPMTSKVYKDQRLGMSFSTAVRNAEGQIIGVLSTRASLSWVEHEITDLYESIAEGALQETELTVLNREGEIVVDYDPSVRKNREVVHDFDVLLKLNLVKAGNPVAQAMVRGERGFVEAMHSRKHVNQLNIYLPLKDEGFLDSLGWSFLMRVDEKALFESLYRTRQLFYGIGSLVLVLCVASGAIFAMFISRRLQSISGGIKETGAAVDGYSRQLSQASEGLASSATEVAASLEETVASLEELVSMVKINAENSEEASQLAKSSSQTAKEGEQEVQSLIVAINEISQSSRKIEEIINVIDDIAFQTNLLALNAAVEAARAGDQGRGFAVVAEAVRNLAQRSGTAAKEITKLIQDNGQKIEQGTRIADRSGQVLQNILKSATKVSDLNQEIAAASREQSTGLTQISKAMNEIDEATQRNASASEQVSTSSGELKGRADALKTMVSQLSELVTAHAEPQQGPIMTSPEPKVSNVTPLHRPTKKNSRLKAASAPVAGKSNAKDMIPFDDEPEAKISSTKGF